MLKKIIWANFQRIIELFTHNLSISSQKYGFEILDPESEIRDPEKTYSGSLIQGSKRHRIPDPDPQHCFCINKFKLFWVLFILNYIMIGQRIFIKKEHFCKRRKRNSDIRCAAIAIVSTWIPGRCNVLTVRPCICKHVCLEENWINYSDLLYCLIKFVCLECLWRSSELDSRPKPDREQIHTEILIHIVQGGSDKSGIFVVQSFK